MALVCLTAFSGPGLEYMKICERSVIGLEGLSEKGCLKFTFHEEVYEDHQELISEKIILDTCGLRPLRKHAEQGSVWSSPGK